VWTRCSATSHNAVDAHIRRTNVVDDDAVIDLVPRGAGALLSSLSNIIFWKNSTSLGFRQFYEFLQ
jgi:hypothetical protein